MREHNKFLNSYEYKGQFDVGGNDMESLKKHYFKTFSDNKNIQPHGWYTNGIDTAGFRQPLYQKTIREKQ